MKLRAVLRAFAGLALACIAISTVGVAASPAAHGKSHHEAHHKTHYRNVYWINLGGTASRAPGRVFFTANAGGFVKNLKWNGWGTRKTVGRGWFGTTWPCDAKPCFKGSKARLIMRKPVICHPQFGNKRGKSVRVYRHTILHYREDGKRKRANVTGTSGWQTCKEAY